MNRDESETQLKRRPVTQLPYGLSALSAAALFFHDYTVGYLQLVAMEVSKVVPITLERVRLRFQ